MANPAPNPIDPYVTNAAFRTAHSDELVLKTDVRPVGSSSLWDRYNAAAVNNFREDLQLALQGAVGEELNPDRVIRSAWEFGAVGDGVANDLTPLQNLLAAVSAAGGGVALIPPSPGGFLYSGGALTIPDNVILKGMGTRSILRPRPSTGNDAINFAQSTARGEVRDLSILGDAASPAGIGIDYTGALYKRARNIQVWDFETGVRFGDGVTQYAAYNSLTEFEINRCEIGLQLLLHSNGCHVSNGRIFWNFDGAGGGVGIDVDGALAVILDSVDVEASDLSLRIRGLVDVDIRGGFLETGDSARYLFDVAPSAGSKIRFRGHTPSATNAIPVHAGLEESLDWDNFDHYPFGARRHHAASSVQNLIENGDFQRADGITTIPQWSFSGSPTAAENTSDFVTAGRSYDLTQAATANDGMSVGGVVPDGVEYITVCVRWKKLVAGSPLFSVTSGGNTSNWDGDANHVPVDVNTWRTATMTVAVDPAANGTFAVTVTADQSQSAGQIRVDEVWAVAGRTAGAKRQHGHRIQLLPTPQELLDRNGIASNEVFGPIDMTALTGLSQPPRGAVGALVRLSGRTTGGTAGVIRTQVINPYLDIPGGAPSTVERLDVVADQVWHTKDVIVRDMSLTGGLNFPGGVGAATDYNLHLLGWVLPS